jgi:3-oxoacyl-[acyl-carrier protein] reductase
MGSEVVVVTGGSGGIGSAVVECFAVKGFRVVLADKVEPDWLKGHPLYRQIFFVETDVTNSDSISNLAANVKINFGEVNHIVGVAGGALLGEIRTPVDGLTDEVIHNSLQLNLVSQLMLVRAFVPLLKYGLIASSGDRSITFISSVNAIHGFSMPVYSAAKAGLQGATVALAAELGSAGIRVNCVAPGTVVHKRSGKGWVENNTEHFNQLRVGARLGRLTVPNDVAEAVFGLTRMKAVTGQFLVVDCGQTI